jgi:hypothetical protein
MSIFSSPLAMTRLLLVDAATCVTMGILLTLAAGTIGRITQIPPALLFYAGLVLFPIGAFMAVVATRPTISPAAVRLIVLGNLAWVAASLLILVGGWIAPNTIGSIFVMSQALVVAALALLEHGALRAAFPRPRTV